MTKGPTCDFEWEGGETWKNHGHVCPLPPRHFGVHRCRCKATHDNADPESVSRVEEILHGEFDSRSATLYALTSTGDPYVA